MPPEDAAAPRPGRDHGADETNRQDAGHVDDEPTELDRASASPDAVALAEAVRLARHGYHLTPVTLTRRPDGRKGARFHRSSWKAEGDVSNDPEVVRAWAVDHPGASFALVCGPSGVEGVDLDVKPAEGVDAVQWWAEQGLPMGSLLVETPSGGLHLIWRRGPGRTLPNRAGQIAPGVDTRNHDGVFFAAGGYVLGEVGHYRVLGALPHVDELAETPDAVLELFPDEQARPDRPADGRITYHDEQWMRAQVAGQLQRVRDHGRGAGGFRHVLNGAAMVVGRLVDAGLEDQAGAVDALREATAAVWGCVDADDEQWIQDGLADGPRKERWRTGTRGRGTTIGHARQGVVLGSSAPAELPVGRPALVLVHDAEHDEPQAEQTRGALNLPAEFWEARPALRHVRDAALSRWACPDAVLGAVLARQSAYAHPRDVVDLGVGLSPLTLFAVPYGVPSAGKGLAVRVAAELLPVPERLADGQFRERPLGSGEGLTESYFGVVTEPDDEGKPVRVRRQVRSNVLFVMDEGEALVKTAGRNGATIATTIRRAWSGEMLGEANASAERDRQLDRGTYSMGLVVAFQPATIGPLFDEGELGGGTPHRFLYMAADDDTLPEEPPEDLPTWPGPLPVPEQHDPELARQWSTPQPRTFTLTDPEALREVRRVRWAGMRRDPNVGPLDGHMNQMRGRVAAHLALFEGRTEVTGEDWRLAGMVVDASNRVRDAAVAYVQARAADRAQRADERHIRREAGAEAARLAVAESAEEARIARGAGVLARKVWATAGGLNGRGVKDALGQRYRDLRAAVIDHAAAQQWIAVPSDGEVGARLQRGPVPPPES